MSEVPDLPRAGAPTFWPGAVVVVTGATSGIGRATALAFARAGARLVLSGRRPDALDEAVEDCRRLGAEAVGRTAEITNREEVEALAALALGRYGALDVWVSCAAVLQYGRFDETPADIVEQVIRTNLIGTFNSARAALSRFRKQGHGVLINTSSVLGLVGHAYTAAYVASKFAIRGLTLSLRQEVKDTPCVHVCAVLPAAIDTPIYGRAANYTGWRIQPIRPLYAPEAVARVILKQARRPRRERFAGAFTAFVTFGATTAPRVMERLIRIVADVTEIVHEPRAPTPGNVEHPVSDGFTVQGGWRARFGLSADGRVLLALVSVLGLGVGAGVAAAARRRR